jgi:hypothetical protein
VYYYLTEQIQRKFIEELRKYWGYHPKYKDTLVKNIQGKYSFRERPQLGIVLKNAAGNQAQLAADNFQGTLQSYIYLAHVEGYPNLSIEWVREDFVAIQNNGGLFPSLPGVYYIDFCDSKGEPTDKEFFVDPLLDIIDETILKINDTQYQLQQGKFLTGTLKVYQMPGNIQLYEGVNYTADSETGEIELILPLTRPEEFLSADYRCPAESTGPWKVNENRALRDPIPGAVLAFGRRITPGDRLAVVVQAKRSLAALEYGGRWDLTLDMDIIARDPLTQREILDQTSLYLWLQARPRLSSMGIEVLSVNMGGETEEIYDDNAQDFYYNGSLSLQLQTDWLVHVPLGICIQAVEPGGGTPPAPGEAPLTPPFMEQVGNLTDEEIAQINNNLKLTANLGLRMPWDPFYVGKNGNPGTYGTGEMLR